MPKPTKSTSTQYNGIKFKSGLELNCYLALIQAGFNPAYEEQSFKIFEGFKSNNVLLYVPSKKTKLNKQTELKLKISKHLDITYTPDFILEFPELLIIIETKGRPNERYPMVKKLFCKYLEDQAEELKFKALFFEPHNKSQINDMINILKNEYNL